MQEFLFRGKRKDGSGWAYGSLIQAANFCCILESEENMHPMDYPYLDGDLGVIDGNVTPVIPETVGRLVYNPGYSDRVGQRYFQGDIIELHARHFEHQNYRRIIGVVCDEHSFTENGFGRRFPQDVLEAKVIGNIHDNPELLEV